MRGLRCREFGGFIIVFFVSIVFQFHNNFESKRGNYVIVDLHQIQLYTFYY